MLPATGRWIRGRPGDYGGCAAPSVSSSAHALPCPAWMGYLQRKGLSHLFSLLWSQQSKAGLDPGPTHLPLPSLHHSLINPQVAGVWESECVPRALCWTVHPAGCTITLGSVGTQGTSAALNGLQRPRIRKKPKERCFKRSVIQNISSSPLPQLGECLQ